MSALAARIAAALGLPARRVEATVQLLDAGNTLPFIARYRKEASGGLDEEQIRAIIAHLERLRALEARRATVLATIEAAGQLGDALRAEILAADSLTALEDLYRPYKPRRRSRATVAREKGLAGLADLVLAQPLTREPAAALARPFLSASVPSAEEALAGARDIVAETVSEDPGVRRRTRDRARAWASLAVEKVADAVDPKGTYQTYYRHQARVDQLKPHQVLALNRGEAEGVLKLRITVPERDWRAEVAATFRPDPRSPLAGELARAIEDGAERLLLPAIVRDLRRQLTERAEAHAIQVFAANLRGLLTQPPLAGHVVLGLDPGFRSGCKLAITDPTGKVLASDTVHPHEPQRRHREALARLADLVARHGVTLVAIGNGTASRETEALVAELVRERPGLHYLLVSEAGASVYSASPLARSELPELDLSLRGAVSIARRAQDPLAELVKIEPKAIGVGLYQHDVDQAALGAALDGVVESVVNRVGVDLNSASPALLAHVAGIGPKLSERIVAHRDATGPFPSRAALKAVPGLGPKAFEQCAGFLRVRGGPEPLDESAIHPESYRVARALLARAGLGEAAPPAARAQALARLRAEQGLASLAAALGTGEPTLADIFEQLLRPGRDPREDLPPPLLRRDVLSMDDLVPGLALAGTVRNVVDFGAFVDIGVKQDGLLHRSRLPRGVRLAVGEVVDVVVENVEPERGRIALAWAGAPEPEP